jgi:hypothetical protein
MRCGRSLVKAGVVSICMVAATAGAPAAAQPPTPSKLLGDALKTRSDWRILDPATDLVGDYTVAQLEALDRWPPWIDMDFDRDGLDDVAAVVVRRAAGGPEFTVAVVHGGTPDRLDLVVPFSPQRIFGVSEGIADDTVMPLRCADCDANVWYRWSGRAYEPLLYAVGEAIRVGGEAGQPSPLFANARPNAAVSTDVPYCARAQVQEVGGEAGKRWYRVEVVGPAFPRGWIPQQLVMSAAECNR